MDLQEAISKLQTPCQAAMVEAEQRWDAIAKPLKSLGLLEQTITKIAGMQKTAEVNLNKRCVVVMCADNGVVAQGVTQCGNEVTAIVTENFAKGCTTVCVMADCVGAAVIPIDIGVCRDIDQAGVIHKKIMYGTEDITKGPAMCHKQAVAAIEVGINAVLELKQQGYRLIATGEMGIGNTTTSSALTALMFNKQPAEVTGIGAGLCSEGLQRKIEAIEKAISINKPNKDDPIDMLAKVGGLDIAGIVGLYIGGAVAGIPILIDGVISAVAANLAVQIAPSCKEYMLASHLSKEPAGKMLLKKLGLKPLLDCEMCLGEGTGAVAAIGLIDIGLTVYQKMCTFSDAAIEQYEALV